MKEPTYGQAFLHAWKAVWHNKILWIFGLFAIFMGQFGFSDVFGKIWTFTDGSWKDGVWSMFASASVVASGGIWSIVGAIWAILIVLFFVILAIFLSVTSQGALISYTSEWFKNESYSNIGKSWKRGLSQFWKIFGFNILRKILLFFLILSLSCAITHFFLSGKIWQNIIFAVLMALILLVSLFVSILSIFATCYAVVDGKGMISALKKSWQLFTEHVFVSLEVGVLLMLLNFVLIALIAAASFLAFLPSLLVWLLAGITNYMWLVSLGMIIGLALWILVLVIAAAMFNAFTTSAWVYLFSKMHKEGMSSKLFHWIKNLF